MSTNIPLPCPSCGYDLSAVQADAGTCPECGGSFSRASIAASRRASMAVALSLVSFGALAGAMMHAGGIAVAYLPHASEGQSGDGAEASRMLALVPFLGVAYGVSLLALTTGRTPAQRRRPVFAAIAFAVCAIVRVSTAQYWSYANYSTWLQAERWRLIADWGFVLAEGLLIIATAWTLGRLGTHLGAVRFRLPLRLVTAAAGALIVLGLLARVHSLYLNELANAPGSNPMAIRPFFETDAQTASVTVMSTIAWWIAWPALGFLALHIRALWGAMQSRAAI